jgi:hypothetical protein
VEHLPSIFRVEEQAKQEINVKACDKQTYLLGLFFGPENGGGIPPKDRFTLTGLHGVIYQKMELYLNVF